MSENVVEKNEKIEVQNAYYHRATLKNENTPRNKNSKIINFNKKKH